MRLKDIEVRLFFYANNPSITSPCALIMGEMEDNMNSISVRFVIFYGIICY